MTVWTNFPPSNFRWAAKGSPRDDFAIQWLYWRSVVSFLYCGFSFCGRRAEISRRLKRANPAGCILQENLSQHPQTTTKTSAIILTVFPWVTNHASGFTIRDQRCTRTKSIRMNTTNKTPGNLHFLILEHLNHVRELPWILEVSVSIQLCTGFKAVKIFYFFTKFS